MAMAASFEAWGGRLETFEKEMSFQNLVGFAIVQEQGRLLSTRHRQVTSHDGAIQRCLTDPTSGFLGIAKHAIPCDAKKKP